MSISYLVFRWRALPRSIFVILLPLNHYCYYNKNWFNYISCYYHLIITVIIPLRHYQRNTNSYNDVVIYLVVIVCLPSQWTRVRRGRAIWQLTWLGTPPTPSLRLHQLGAPGLTSCLCPLRAVCTTSTSHSTASQCQVGLSHSQFSDITVPGGSKSQSVQWHHSARWV